MGAPTWKLAKGQTWRGKLEREHPNHGKVVPVPVRMRKSLGKGTMLIPRPLDVDAAMRRARKGRLISLSQIRGLLAAAGGADHACPLTTGIFVRVAAEAAEEDRRAGKKRITPYWRTVRDDGTLNDKFPGGARAQAALLRGEGVRVAAGKGKKPPCVPDLERYLTKREAPMRSSHEDVDSYLAEVPAERRPVLAQLRRLIRRVAPGIEETMRHGMPSYEIDGRSLCSFASQKDYLCLYLCETPLVEKHRKALGTTDIGKSCIRYRKPDAVPLAAIEKLLQDAVKQGGAARPSRAPAAASRKAKGEASGARTAGVSPRLLPR
jgi:uncharacterized protein YdhG (YjbR/CyaY superfamily)